MDLNQIALFYNEVKNLCKPDEYNLVLHKHLGDVFYAIGLKDEFERVYGKKLHFIVRPQYEFLMKLFGVDHYSVYDFKSFEKRVLQSDWQYMPYASHESHKFDMLCKDAFSSVPLLNIPFVIDGDLNSFFLFNHYWCFLWGHNMGLNIKNFKFAVPKNKLPIQPELLKKLKKVGPVDKIVLFAPEAATAIELPVEFWNIFADQAYKRGYKIIVNSKKYKIHHAVSAFDLGLSIEEVVALGLNCAYVFSVRSGLCDVLVGAGEKLYAFYPAMLAREMNSLKFPFAEETKVHEFLLQKWRAMPVVWEGIDFTPDLQKYINSIRINYIVEKIKCRFARKKNKPGHAFWFKLFKNIFGKGKVFPDNNTDYEKPKLPAVNKKFSLYVPLYEKKVNENGTVKKCYVLGGLFRFKSNIRHQWTLSFSGIKVLHYNKKHLKLFYLPVWKFNWRKKWLNKLQRQIDPCYDDIYFLRHNIGETTAELMMLKERLKVNKSKKPLLIVWNKKNIGYYEMFVKNIVDIKYIQLYQEDIMNFFSQKGNNREIIVEQNHQRFICSSPDIAVNMSKNHKINFYSHIRRCCRVPARVKLTLPVVSAETQESVARLMNTLNLNQKFVILAPEATSIVKLPPEFWQDIVTRLSEKGYDVFMNAFLSDSPLGNVKTHAVSLDELFCLAQKADRVITLGSGLAVLLSLADVPMDIIYTELPIQKINYSATFVFEKYSVFHLPVVRQKEITEYNVDTFSLEQIKQAVFKKL